jgi:hypothetical protein
VLAEVKQRRQQGVDSEELSAVTKHLEVSAVHTGLKMNAQAAAKLKGW